MGRRSATAGSSDTSFSGPVAYKASAGPYQDPNAGEFGTPVPVSRWGDYSSAVADPQDPAAFWISSEYGTTPGSWEWGTVIAQVRVGPDDGADHGRMVASRGHFGDAVAVSEGIGTTALKFISSQDAGLSPPVLDFADLVSQAGAGASFSQFDGLHEVPGNMPGYGYSMPDIAGVSDSYTVPISLYPESVWKEAW